MKNHRAFPLLLLLGIVGLVATRAEAAEEIPNWPAPPFWQPAAPVSGDGLQLNLLAVSSPLPFIAISPCRVADTRGNAAPIQGGIFANSEARDWTVSGVCGIANDSSAVSVNFTVTGSPPTIPQGAFLLAWPAGQAPPPTAVMTYGPAQTISNAAVVPVNGAGQMTVNVSHSTHVIMDVNGYYAAASIGMFNTFLGLQAGNSTMTGDGNTAVGRSTFRFNTTGTDNTAMGYLSLFQSDTGDSNTGVGYAALRMNDSGDLNTAVGHGALSNNTSGGSNIGIGVNAGLNLTTGSNNICIGNTGVAGESSTIRIGTTGVATYIAGIYNQLANGGSAVYVASDGKLGTITGPSSRRFKEDIRDIADLSDGLMTLRPVVFRYKRDIDPSGLPQYGLIAEEVAEVYPELVAYGRDGQPETVRYHLVNALLLNEVQKQHRSLDSQQAEIEALKDRLRKLEARLPAFVRDLP